MRNNVFITPFVEAIHYHLHQYEMPSVELSVRLKMSTEEFTQLMNGERRLDENTANMLELIFCVPANEWLALEQASHQITYMNQA